MLKILHVGSGQCRSSGMITSSKCSLHMQMYTHAKTPQEIWYINSHVADAS